MLKKITIVMILSGVLYFLWNAITYNGINNLNELYTNTAALENVNYVIQIIAGIFVIGGTLIAVWQYILASRDSKMNRNREYQLHEKEIFEMERDRIQKAIDLAGYYKDNVLTKVMIISNIYKQVGIFAIISKINFENISHFDKIEMEGCIAAADREFIKNAPKKKEMSEALVMASEVLRIWEECKEIEVIEENGKKVKSLSVLEGAMLIKFRTVLNEILNNLEFFAMHFTHGTADDSVVYQSLHQNYIETVRLLYYDISANNIPGESKLYTNVIELYNEWTQKAKEQKNNETEVARDNISKGKTLNRVDSR